MKKLTSLIIVLTVSLSSQFLNAGNIAQPSCSDCAKYFIAKGLKTGVPSGLIAVGAGALAFKHNPKAAIGSARSVMGAGGLVIGGLLSAAGLHAMQEKLSKNAILEKECKAKYPAQSFFSYWGTAVISGVGSCALLLAFIFNMSK